MTVWGWKCLSELCQCPWSCKEDVSWKEFHRCECYSGLGVCQGLLRSGNKKMKVARYDDLVQQLNHWVHLLADKAVLKWTVKDVCSYYTLPTSPASAEQTVIPLHIFCFYRALCWSTFESCLFFLEIPAYLFLHTWLFHKGGKRKKNERKCSKNIATKRKQGVLWPKTSSLFPNEI